MPAVFYYAEGLQMLNGCLVCYVKLLMCNWTFFHGRHQTLITTGWSDSESISTKIEQTRHLWRPGLRNRGLLKSERAPRTCLIALHIANVRTMAILRNHPRKALFKIKTPLWSAESTSANIAPRGWSRRASAVVRRRRRLRAAATGDLTARGCCSFCCFQLTKCDKKLTSVS